MAQVDVQWPSEDEDFDATIDKAIKSRADGAETSPARTAVAVQGPTDEKPEPVSVPDEAEVNAPEGISEEPIDKEQGADAEATAPEAEPEPEAEVAEPEPAQAETPPPVVPLNPAPAKGGKPGMGRTIFEAVLVLAVIGLAGWSYMLMSDKNDSQAQVTTLKAEVQKLNDNPQIAVQKQTDDLLAKVSALIDLPKGETPTVANVSDAEAAKKQSAFFNNAQNGDRVLMYVKAGQAILYRPSTNKIILVAPLTFTGTGSTTSTTPATTTKKP